LSNRKSVSMVRGQTLFCRKTSVLRKSVCPRLLIICLIIAALSPALGGSPAASQEPPRYNDLYWSDEFNGPGIDLTTWNYETEENGWSHTWNKELQRYVDDGKGGENAFVRDGCLVIRALKVNDANEYGSYTSARLTTKGTREFQYGRISARMKLPYGQGVWPAFWMLGSSTAGHTWPKCGEIDIMELVGGSGGKKSDRTVHGTLHGEGYSGDKGITGHYQLAAGKKFADAFHVFEIEWDEKGITWFVDGTRYNRILKTDISRIKGAAWDFDHPFYILVNLAIGGGWPGKPDGTTIFPQYLYVDWIRVYR